MTRRKAAKQTAEVLALFWALGWALERWPYATTATLSVVSIYKTFREAPELEREA